jgi:AraC family transcriptional regulator, regulatory protein of adaptative response / DNA-3-methyladenine glycosylase II
VIRFACPKTANFHVVSGYYGSMNSAQPFAGLSSLGLDHDQCYQAFKSHDTRFDGRLFVCVKTTRIYCRPVCRVKPPMLKNCYFVANAPQAERLGYRPCLRCRPELSPGFSASQASSRLAFAAAAMLQLPQSGKRSIDSLALRIGVTPRHLRRLFFAEFGVSPIEYAQTQRLLLAKRLLTDTALPMSVICQASGFRSVRRFNDLFQAQYRLAPSALRKEHLAISMSSNSKSNKKVTAGVLTVNLAYRPPYAWDAHLQYLSGRLLNGVEYVDQAASIYWRSAKIKDCAGWIGVSNLPTKNALQVVLSQSLAPVIGELLVLVRRLFDLDARPDEIAKVLSQPSPFDFSSLLSSTPGLRLAGAFDGFELAVRAVLGQLVSVKAAHATASKLVKALGRPLTEFSASEPCPCEHIHLLTIEPSAVLNSSQEDLGVLGITRMKQGALKALAQALIDQTIVLDPTSDVPATMTKLMALPGIGDWTTQYIAMRALAWPDAFPAGDYGVLKALGGTAAQAVKTAQAWRPWRAYATRYLWHGL